MLYTKEQVQAMVDLTYDSCINDVAGLIGTIKTGDDWLNLAGPSTVEKLQEDLIAASTWPIPFVDYEPPRGPSDANNLGPTGALGATGPKLNGEYSYESRDAATEKKFLDELKEAGVPVHDYPNIECTIDYYGQTH